MALQILGQYFFALSWEHAYWQKEKKQWKTTPHVKETFLTISWEHARSHLNPVDFC